MDKDYDWKIRTAG